ncbi:MAG: murein biosynthesis integral membrane protein MurJ [Deltaproteobacteria bacterium]|nr:murein biosynthesis integral membrane protein MurJ [Deltaproteobacteria bacterium]
MSESGTEKGAIVRRAGLVAAGTLTSRVLGAVRDAVIAMVFPVAATDAFFVAFTIPNALRVLLGEGAVAGAFVPVFSEVREKHGFEAAARFQSKLVAAMALVLLAVTLLGVAFSPALVELYAAGFHDTPGRFEETVALTRVVFPYIFLMGLSALATGALNAVRRFAAPAFAPALLNVALIAGAFALVPAALRFGLPGVGALALGALIGGTLQILAQLPSLRVAGLLRRPRLDLRDPWVRKAFRLMLPLLLGLGVYQLNIMLTRQLASFLPAGSVSYLYYGQRLVEIPQGMFALAIASAALPTLSTLRARGDDEKVKEVFRYGLGLSLFVAIPSAVGLASLATPVVSVLFGRGRFTPLEVELTSRSLVWMAAGIWSVASVRTIVPMFYAYNDTRTPVIGSAANLIVFGAVALTTMGPLKHVGLAMAVTAASIAQLITLLALLRRRVGRLGLKKLTWNTLRVLLASLLMAGAIQALLLVLPFASDAGLFARASSLIACVLGGAATYALSAWLLRVPELRALTGALGRRFKR